MGSGSCAWRSFDYHFLAVFLDLHLEALAVSHLLHQPAAAIHEVDRSLSSDRLSQSPLYRVPTGIFDALRKIARLVRGFEVGNGPLNIREHTVAAAHVEYDVEGKYEGDCAELGPVRFQAAYPRAQSCDDFAAVHCGERCVIVDDKVVARGWLEARQFLELLFDDFLNECTPLHLSFVADPTPFRQQYAHRLRSLSGYGGSSLSTVVHPCGGGHDVLKGFFRRHFYFDGGHLAG